MHKRLAEVLVGYSTAVRKGDTVRIESYDTSALPAMRETFGAALRAGGHPTANLVVEEFNVWPAILKRFGDRNVAFPGYMVARCGFAERAPDS